MPVPPHARRLRFARGETTRRSTCKVHDAVSDARRSGPSLVIDAASPGLATRAAISPFDPRPQPWQRTCSLVCTTDVVPTIFLSNRLHDGSAKCGTCIPGPGTSWRSKVRYSGFGASIRAVSGHAPLLACLQPRITSPCRLKPAAPRSSQNVLHSTGSIVTVRLLLVN